MTSEVNLKQKVADWLNKNGYPLEMRVASMIRKYSDFAIRQGWHYIDVESGDSREIDIVCTAEVSSGVAEINFVIECKSTKKPWVLFTSDDAADSYHELNSFGIFSELARKELSTDYLSETRGLSIEDKDRIPWFKKDGLLGYSIAQAFEGNKDAPYNASLSTIKAATWLKSNSLWQNSAEYRPYAISFPIIVTDVPLFECSLGEDNEPALKEIDHGYLFFKQHVSESYPTCISIVTESYLKLFIKECNVVAGSLLEALEEPY